MSVALPLEPSICITNEELTLQADEYQRQLVGSHRQCSAVTVYIWYPWCQTRKDEKTLPRGSHIPLLCHCRHLLWNIPTRHKKALVIRFTNALNSESGLFIIQSLSIIHLYIDTYPHMHLYIQPTFTATLAEAVVSDLVPLCDKVLNEATCLVMWGIYWVTKDNLHCMSVVWLGFTKPVSDFRCYPIFEFYDTRSARVSVPIPHASIMFASVINICESFPQTK